MSAASLEGRMVKAHATGAHKKRRLDCPECEAHAQRQLNHVPVDAIDPVGAVEIAARLGVKRDTVDHWRRRHAAFPPPRWTVGGRPAWAWADVAAWHAGRAGTATS